MKTLKLHPVDYVVAGYNLVLAAIWSHLIGRVDYAPLVFVAHVAALFLPRLLERMPSRPSPLVANLRLVYPMLWVLVFWTELSYLLVQLPVTAKDGAISSLDRAIFGVHLHDTWIASMPQVWLSETMHFSYFIYYALIAIPPLVLMLQGRTVALRDAILRLTIAYLGCYLVYIFYPVLGPHHLGTPYDGSLTEGLFYRLTRSAQTMSDPRGAAFPSSHVVGSVTIAIIGWRWFSRPVAILLSLEALGVVTSTVYTQNHYAVDSLAGVLWAFALQGMFVPAFVAWVRPIRRSRQPVPQLPGYQPALDSTGDGT